MKEKELLMTITSNGQVTIPAKVRRHPGLAKNRKIVLVTEEQGTVRLRVPRYPNIASVRGAAGILSKKLSWRQMRDIARADHLRSKSKKP